MSDPQVENKEQQSSAGFTLPMQKNSQILALFAVACTAVVGLVHELTKDTIKAQAQHQLLATLHSIIEPSRYNNAIALDCVHYDATDINPKLTSEINTAYIARNNNTPVAIAMTTTAPDGYNGNIELIIAMNMDDSVSGVRVLSHKETPGLGDKIEVRKSRWITEFTGKALLSYSDSRWAVAKDNGMFDQFTGATITPRAVVNAVKKTVQFFKANKAQLLASDNKCLIDSPPEQAATEISNDR